MYSKIFRQIYEGTLCTKGPWQALVTFQQFIILADRYGIVDMTAEAIARITTIPLDIIRLGITALEQPDDGSRTPDMNGKRIVRLRPHTDWGWQVVNYEHFSAIRSAEDRKEYQREYYETKLKKKRKSQQQSTESTESTESTGSTGSTPQTQTDIHKHPCASRSAPDGAFAKFWTAYPRKKSKGQAMKAWRQLPAEQHLDIMHGLKIAIMSDDWGRDHGKYIPYPATWLNARGWEDEPQAAAPRKFVI